MSAGRLLHVLGGSPWQTPTVQRARELGLRVLVTDMYAERPAYAVADLHEQVDITDLEATLEVARRHGVQGVLCDTTDVGVCTAAFVAERLGLPGMGLETARNFTDKARMRDCARRAGWQLPAFERVHSRADLDAAAARIGPRLVLKPVDNQSGRGVSIVDGPAGLAAAFERARAFSRSGELIAEQWVEGPEIIVDGFSLHAKVQILGIAAKVPYVDNPTISSRIEYLSGTAFDALAGRVTAAAQRLITAMGLGNGVFHAEFILHHGQPVPIDVAARGGGVMIYTHVLKHVCGVDVMAAMIRLAMGEAVTVAPIAARRGASVDFFRLPAGRLQEFCGVADACALPGIAAVHLNAVQGDEVGSLLKKDDRPGFVVALAETTSEAVTRAQAAKLCLSARLDDGRVVPIA